MNEGHAFSFAIKSFSSGKYLKVHGDVASDTLSVSFTGHFNACDTRILFDKEWISGDNHSYSVYRSVAFQSFYLAVDKKKLVLSRQSRDPQATESKCHFRVSRVKVAYDFDGPTMYHAVNPRDDNSSFIRSSKSGNITLRKRWRFDCGAWMYFNDSIPSCSSDHLRSNK
ncbi:uncharacterized protein LOC141881740 [Acropora palmata]|uniref:uncharacterized protein LOC141881740 n=1 Tax=Acropora palmata TaxID=6131 RepID=UPI003DA16F21